MGSGGRVEPFWPALRSPRTSQGCVDRDPRQPVRQRRPPGKAADRRETAHIGALHHILGLLALLEHAPGDPEQSLVVALGHDPHRGAIARGDPRRQFQIGKPARVGPWLHRHPSSIPPPPWRGSDPSTSLRRPASAPNSPPPHLLASATPCSRPPRLP